METCRFWALWLWAGLTGVLIIGWPIVPTGMRHKTRGVHRRAPNLVAMLGQPVMRTPVRLAQSTQKRHFSASKASRWGTWVETPRRSVKIRPMYHCFTKEVECNVVPKFRTAASACLRIRAELKLAACARRTTLLVVAPCHMKGHCASERPLPFGARPCCDVPAAASNTQPACACART